MNTSPGLMLINQLQVRPAVSVRFGSIYFCSLVQGEARDSQRSLTATPLVEMDVKGKETIVTDLCSRIGLTKSDW